MHRGCLGSKYRPRWPLGPGDNDIFRLTVNRYVQMKRIYKTDVTPFPLVLPDASAGRRGSGPDYRRTGGCAILCQADPFVRWTEQIARRVWSGIDNGVSVALKGDSVFNVGLP